jgi:hypothetical protein
MTDASSLKYLIKKVNNLEISDTVLTDKFCVIGCDSSIDYNDETEEPILGNTKPLAYTYDGITYIPSSNTILYKINKVDFNGYQWIACGSSVDNSQSLVLSSDGINWITPVNNLMPEQIIDVAWGQKKWVAVGTTNSIDDYIYRFAYSSDGMNWTLSNYNDDGKVSFYSVAYNGSYFLAGGYNYIAKSTNGNTWTDVNVGTLLGAVRSITWNGHIWVAACNNVTPIGYSYNGVDWFSSASADLIFNAGTVVSWNGTQFLVGGSGLYKLISSKDGINWIGVMLTINEEYLPGSITDITWNGVYWIVTSATNDSNEPKIAYSSDLVTWHSSNSGNELFSGITEINTITSRNRKNYLAAITF